MSEALDVDAVALGITLLGLRFAVEVQPKPRARNWTLVAVCVDLADAEYLADTYRGHEQRRARVIDTTDGTIVHDTKDTRR